MADHKLSLDPNAAWKAIKNSQVFDEVPTVVHNKGSSNNDSSKDYTRIVCMSDTHGFHREIFVPKGDVLVHAGDFTSTGEIDTIHDVIDYFQQLAFPTTICIAGNHDLTMEVEHYKTCWKRFHKKPLNAKEARKTILKFMEKSTKITSKFIYLEDSSCAVPTTAGSNNNPPAAIPFYGSPYTPEFYDWAYNAQRGQPLWDIWSKIPKETDVLVTHGPPLGRGDLCIRGGRAGCYDLLHHTQHLIRPRVHIFGHIHEGFGTAFDGSTLYVNASNLDVGYEAVNPCIVVDLPHDRNQPARVVQPYCNVTGDDWMDGSWLVARGYNTLAEALRESRCPPKDLPFSKTSFLEMDTAEMYKLIRPRLRKQLTSIQRSKTIKKELLMALSQLYAESFD